MSLPKLGFRSSVGIGVESTYATPVARAVWFPLISESMKVITKKSPRPTLAESTGSRNRRSHALMSKEAGGTIELLVTYEGAGLLIQAATGGTPATTGPTGSIYLHKYTLASGLPSLTIEVVRGNGAAEVFAGCKVSKLTLKAAQGGFLRATLEIIAQDSEGRVSAGTPSYTTSRDLVITFPQCGTVGWNASTYPWTSFEVSVDNKLTRRPLAGGGLLTAEPAPADFCDVMVKAELEWIDDSLWTAHHADTSADLTMVCTGTGSRTLTIKANTSNVEEVSDPINTAGIIKQSATWRSEMDSGSEGFEVWVENEQSDALAA